MAGYVKKTNCRVYGSNPCWVCQNAGGGCEWTDEDPETGHTSFKPVPGWEAIEATLRADKGQPRVTTYRILRCPKFKPMRGNDTQRHLGAPPRPVIATDVNGEAREFASIGEAARATGARDPNIIAACNGKIKTAGGYKWRYADAK